MHSIRHKCSLNVLQMMTNIQQLTRFDIVYHTRVIYKRMHIKNMFWILVLKQIKFT